MNYRHIYMIIIEKAKNEQKIGKRKKGNGEYYESHHILPKSLFPLWEKRSSNLVLLTAREHYFCHQLLIKIFKSQQMANALFRMSTSKANGNYICSTREYEIARKYFIELNDFAHGMKIGEFRWYTNGEKEVFSKECPKDFHLGRIYDIESKIKAGKTNKERNKIRGSVQSRMTEERHNLWRQHLSETHRDGKEVYANMPDEVKKERAEKISKALKGKEHSSELKKKISEGIHKSPKHKEAVEKTAAKHRGKKFFNNGEVCILAETCPDGFVPGMLKRQGSQSKKE